jgi:hypothetical protein
VEESCKAPFHGINRNNKTNKKSSREGRREKGEIKMKLKNNIFLLLLTTVFLVGSQGWGMEKTDDEMVKVECSVFNYSDYTHNLYFLSIDSKDLNSNKSTTNNHTYFVLIKLKKNETYPKISPSGKANFDYVDDAEKALTKGLFYWRNRSSCYKASHPDPQFDETPNPKIIHPSKSLYKTIKPPEEQPPPSSPKQTNLSPKIHETNIFKNTIQKLKDTLVLLVEKIRGGGQKKEEIVEKPVYLTILDGCFNNNKPDTNLSKTALISREAIADTPFNSSHKFNTSFDVITNYHSDMIKYLINEILKKISVDTKIIVFNNDIFLLAIDTFQSQFCAGLLSGIHQFFEKNKKTTIENILVICEKSDEMNEKLQNMKDKYLRAFCHKLDDTLTKLCIAYKSNPHIPTFNAKKYRLQLQN